MARVYPVNFEEKIGFDKIRGLIKSNCLCTLGKELTDKMIFLTDKKEVLHELSGTDEFLKLITTRDDFPTDFYFDLRSSLKKINIVGRFLEIEELFDLRRSLKTISAIVKMMSNLKEEDFPVLKSIVSEVGSLPEVVRYIDDILTPNGKIKDNASAELAKVRRDLQNMQGQISRRLRNLLKKAQQDGFVEEDANISFRDGRPVIPVPSSVKRKINGIVHDESASGKTSYVEPAEVVEMNNELLELEYNEKREIIKVLIDLANKIRPYVNELIRQYEILGMLDFLRAKALLARRMNAVKPIFGEGCIIDWEKAIHPLLQFNLEKDKKKIVPLDIRLTSENHILLISGPNAGGKSVCLKTVGLLQYMLQCGMMVPMDEEGRVGVFDQIFIDIGDEQSIENDLSTYSSHLLNMKYFVKNSNEHTLILMDEFGTGTEPILGGAIAESVLDQLNQIGTFGVITTHYTSLKQFASVTDGIENGAMIYDAGKMEPQFRLEIGKPGSSFAFEIARKIGMPESILQKATEKIGKEHVDYDKHLRDISRDKRYWEAKRKKIHQQEKTLDQVSLRYEENLQKLESERKKIISEAKAEAQQVIEEANKKVESTIREIRENHAEKEKTKAIRKDLSTFKEKVFKIDTQDQEWLAQKIQRIKAKKKKYKKREEKSVAATVTPEKKQLEAGDSVRLESQRTIGEIIELQGKNAVVAFGQLRTTVKTDRLKYVSRNEAKQESHEYNLTRANVFKNISEKKSGFKSEIDLRGERAEEALLKIQSLLDEAVMVNASELRILHGKGNGILREVIREYLKTDPVVKSFRDEDIRYGGTGITIVELN